MKFNKRRTLLKAAAGWVVAAGLPGFLPAYAADRSKPKSAPVWAGFGLNGGPDQARYELTRRYLQKKRGGVSISDSQAFKFMNDALKEQLTKLTPQLVVFKPEVKLGEDYLLGMAHDYEASTAIRRVDLKEPTIDGSIVTFLSGVGLILNYEKSSGWRIMSSFSFVTRDTRKIPDVSKASENAVDMLGDSYLVHATAFATFLGRFGKWNAGYSPNFFARVTSSKVTEGALTQLQEYKLDQKFNADFLGFQASAAICDGLDIPLLPFKETDALANRYATKFSESLITQDKIAIPNADLEFEVVLIKATKEKVPSRQQGIIYLKRRIIIGIRIFDRGLPADQQKILQVVAGAPEDSDIIRYDQPDDDNPDRDFVFFDRLLYRTLSGLMKGIAKNDAETITSLGVNYDSIKDAIPKVLKQCANAR